MKSVLRFITKLKCIIWAQKTVSLSVFALVAPKIKYYVYFKCDFCEKLSTTLQTLKKNNEGTQILVDVINEDKIIQIKNTMKVSHRGFG